LVANNLISDDKMYQKSLWSSKIHLNKKLKYKVRDVMTWLHTQCKLQINENWKQSSDYNCAFCIRWRDISKVIQNWSEIKIYNEEKLHNKINGLILG